ncbi:MAG: electron transfer flavoprotein subunit beta/FixA family protein [Deltaproteobacteria bacterium]|nr:electron transfer flavoprotein subunit beta/FixA family protein [Deltaproteobacteria bacterium]
MKIGVLIKQVPDTETKIRIKADKSGIEEDGVKFIVNPYDELAIEEAIKTKEKTTGETYAISLGPDRAVEAIRTALAMGIDKGIHIATDGQTFDGFTTAKILSEVIKKEGLEIVFCGKQAIDGDNGQVVAMTAEFLDIPQVMIVEKVELKEDKKGALITRRVSGGKEVYDVAFPAILGCEKGLNTPRYASLPGIMKAKSKPLEKLKAADLLGGATKLVRFANYEFPPERAAGKKIDGEPAQQAAQLVRLLREEAKVI